jgi:hypothetical protein
VRVGWALLHKPPRGVKQAAGQEGLAAALADIGAATPDAGPLPEPDPSDRSVAAALDVFGEDTELATRAALLYGDEVARQFGWTPLGVKPGAGYSYCRAKARAALESSSPKALLRDAWTPAV